ncbi:MAG: hypothetical protein MUC97_17265 [Bernardetiaceae bacterium]|nr:hypothetical protein [Bernardetiaceae bacterium]
MFIHHPRLERAYTLVASASAPVKVTPYGIELALDWSATPAPVLLPPLAVTEANLLGVAAFCQGEYELAVNYFNEHPASQGPVELAFYLTRQQTLPARWLADFAAGAQRHAADYYRLHNLAVAYHLGYAGYLVPLAQTKAIYALAYELAPTPDHQAFTARWLAQLLADSGQYPQAQDYLERSLAKQPSVAGQMALKSGQAYLLIKRAAAEPNPAYWPQAQMLVAQLLAYHEPQPQGTVQCLAQAADLAEHTSDVASALKYWEQALGRLPDSAPSARLAYLWLRRANALHQSAQSGHTGHWPLAAEAYRTTLHYSADQPSLRRYVLGQLLVAYLRTPAPATGLRAEILGYAKEHYQAASTPAARQRAEYLLKQLPGSEQIVNFIP